MGKVLKILGIVFLVIIVAVVGMMFWAHGEGQAQQQRFFDAVASGEPENLIGMFHMESIKTVDPPVIKMWMEHVNSRLGAYQGLAASKFNTEKKTTTKGSVVISEGRAEFEKGQAEVKLILLNDKIASFEVTSDALKGNWVKLPLEGPFYRNRAKKFIKHLIDLEIQQALDMTHKDLKKQFTVEQCRKGLQPLLDAGGKLLEIKVIDEQFIDGEEDKSLKIALTCKFEKGKLLSYVRFDFDSVRAHLMGFKLPCTPEEAGVDPAKLQAQE